MKSTKEVMAKINTIFCLFAETSTVVSDKVSFNSYRIRLFARDWDVCIFVSSHFPESICMVDR